MDEGQVRTQTEQLLTHVKRSLQKSLDWEHPGWDPDRAYEAIQKVMEEKFPKDRGFQVKLPTREKLVALRLMGEDIKNTLHIDIEYNPPTMREWIAVNFVIGDKIQ